ncbi:MAG: DNA-binding response regulator [Actinobacteria bacterium]|nr:MAG: DNA-binding response regulator [Actinomycetota bacterium]
MRILLADDQTEIRSALRLWLDQNDGLSVVAESADAADLLSAAAATQAQLVLLDWELPGVGAAGTGGEAAGLLSRLQQASPGVKVVAMSGRPEARKEAIHAGADAFVSKCEPPEALLSLLSELAAGDGCGD